MEPDHTRCSSDGSRRGSMQLQLKQGGVVQCAPDAIQPTHSTPPRLGRIHHKRRKEAGPTQRDLAARLRVSQSWVACVEAGQRASM